MRSHNNVAVGDAAASKLNEASFGASRVKIDGFSIVALFLSGETKGKKSRRPHVRQGAGQAAIESRLNEDFSGASAIYSYMSADVVSRRLYTFAPRSANPSSLQSP